MKDILETIKFINEIVEKFNKKKKMTVDEIKTLGLFYSLNNKQLLNDSIFDYFKFNELYLVYSKDLNFKTTFYKRNPNKKLSETIDHKKLDKINSQEFNFKVHKDLEAFYIENQLIIPVEKFDVEKDKIELEKYAKNWAKISLNERHSPENLKIISKETRDTLDKLKIEKYHNNQLSLIETNDVFKGLLKLYHIFHEGQRIEENRILNNENNIFSLNGTTVEINYYSIIHILNRHYGEILSSLSIIDTKSFHNPKINPEKIHLFIGYLFDNIKSSGIEKMVKIVPGHSIIIKYYGYNYALFFQKYKHNKSKIILDTFFLIEPENINAKNLIAEIENSESIKLNEVLNIYIKKTAANK